MRSHRPYRRAGRVANPTAARTAMERVAQRLGVAVLVEAVEPGPPTTIRAVLLYVGVLLGNAEQAVSVSATNEATAWRKLAVEIIAWRRGNAMAIAFWPGGG